MRFSVQSLFVATTLQQLFRAVEGGNYTNSKTSAGSAYGSNYYVDSQNTAYDGYAQAWRYLGWYVECGNPSDRYSQQSHHSDDYQYYYANNWCQRFLMWAMVRRQEERDSI